MITTSIIPSHTIADWILQGIEALLKLLHIGDVPILEEILYTAVILAIALGGGWAVRKIVVWVAKRLIKIHHSALGEQILDQRVITRCSHVIPPLVLLALIPFAFSTDPRTLSFVMRVVVVYGLCMLAVAINAVIELIWTRYDERENTNNHPLRGVVNVLHGVVWIIIVIVGVSILVNKSPAYLLTGLGAFAAALLLIFKDSILGFVAGIQLSQNDMLRVGDWIVVPSTIANGVVIDVTLTVVKIRNWDNTTVMLPPYTLVSTSFQNWRGMSDAGRRQISRQVFIDNATIRPLHAGEADELAAKYPILKEFVAKGVTTVYDPGLATVNGTMSTNLGLFRAYMCTYLLKHPEVASDSQILVRLMQPEQYGTPLQIYCYTTTTQWTAYEAIQSEIFEHMAAVAPAFGLNIYNATDGADFVVHQGAPVAAPDSTSEVQTPERKASDA